ncbi:YdcH family protein [Cobetia amphilecti]|uniref:YdcH family protein n=1 Tax=Cobetia amphilecti TaxID=1055104 RepID=UPI0033805C67|nr:hypothetical protein [Gammaproteobacteria bacterium]
MHIDDHSLCNDFPQQRELILRLINGNEGFARIAEAYTRIDTEIHALEVDDRRSAMTPCTSLSTSAACSRMGCRSE